MGVLRQSSSWNRALIIVSWWSWPRAAPAPTDGNAGTGVAEQDGRWSVAAVTAAAGARYLRAGPGGVRPMLGTSAGRRTPDTVTAPATSEGTQRCTCCSPEVPATSAP